MVFLSLAENVKQSAQEVVEGLRRRGVLVSAVSERGFRLVTHYWIDDTAVQRAVAEFAGALA
jgi:threonine aldolase